MAWMLDTNTLSDLIKNPQGAIAARLRQLDTDAVCTSIVVACELRFGAQKRGSGILSARVEELLGNLSVLGLDPGTDRHYADIRCALEQAGTPIGSHDLFIAAHARAFGFGNAQSTGVPTRSWAVAGGLAQSKSCRDAPKPSELALA